MKRSLKLFNKIGKKPRRKQDIKDYEEEFEDDFYEEDDFDEEFDEEYGDEDYAEDEDYADEEYYGREDDADDEEPHGFKAYSREKHGDFDHELREDDDFDLELSDPEYEDDDYPEEDEDYREDEDYPDDDDYPEEDEDYPEDEEGYPEDEDYPEEDDEYLNEEDNHPADKAESDNGNVVPFPVKSESDDNYAGEDDTDEDTDEEEDYTEDAIADEEDYADESSADADEDYPDEDADFADESSADADEDYPDEDDNYTDEESADEDYREEESYEAAEEYEDIHYPDDDADHSSEESEAAVVVTKADDYDSDDFEDDDYDPEFEEAYGSHLEDEEFADEDYRDEDIDDNYADDDRYAEDERYAGDNEEVDDRYVDEEDDVNDRYDDDYRDDYRYARKDDRYEDVENRYADEEDDAYDRYEDGDRYSDEDYDRYDDDYRDDDDDYYAVAGPSRAGRSDRSGRSPKRSRGHRHHNNEGIGAKVFEFIKNSSFAERAAAVIAVLLVAGGLVTMSFYSKALDRNAEINAFTEVGANMQFNDVIGASGLLAVADAERARAMTANIIAEDAEVEEEEEEEVEVPDDAPGVTVRMTLTTIKSDMKVKFINSETKKLVANVPFTINVVTPDGTTITYDDHDRDGIIYKNNLTAGKYTVTPNALPEEFSNYTLELGAQALTIKDKVETKVVDVSNEIKKESQVNAAKEDTAVQTVVESALTDTVEWVDSNQGSVSGDGNYEYEEVSKEDVANLISGAAMPSGTVKRLSARRGRTENPSETPSETPSEAPAEASTEASSENPEVAGEARTGEEGSSTDASNNAASEASSEGASTAPTPQDMSLSTSATVNAGETTTITVSGPSQVNATSADTAIAEVSVNGTSVSIKGIAPGTTSVTVEATDFNSATISVTVNQAALPKISLSTTSLTLKSGEEGRIEASGVSGDLTVSPTDSQIASVSVSGTTIVVKGNTVGEVTFTVSAADHENASFKAIVTATDKTDMTVDPADKTLSMGIDEEKSFNVTGPSAITATSDKSEVATVEASGTTFKIKAIANGTANIKIEAENYNPYTISVTVGDGAELKLNSTKVTLTPGKTFKLQPEVSGATPEFVSENTDIATVEADGTITGVNAGDTKIKVTCAGYREAFAEVKVIAADTVLKDKDGNILWVKEGDEYREAKYSDYFNPDITVFYLRKEAEGDGVRHGWWTIDGKTYYYDKDGNAVTGEQVIKGAKYSFGSDGALSSSSGTLGIDVSKWNGNIDWNKVKKSGVNFVIIRCGYRGSSAGALIEDPKFRSYMKGAQAAGLRVGVYFFSQAVNEVEAVEEASMCINLCNGYNLSFPIYLDVEGSNGRGDGISASQRTANIKAFCGTIQSAGYRAGVYSNKTWFTQNINVSALTNYKIWLAQYAANVSYSASRYDMWQYTSKGSVSGISGNVDMNILYN